MNITLIIQQSKVYAEVAQTTEYTGDRMVGDDGSYERIRTTDVDNDELQRFWNECRAEIAESFQRKLVSEGMYASASSTTPTADGDYYKLTLDVASALGGFGAGFNTSLLPSMELGLFSYFVQGIAARWYTYTNKGEAEPYAVKAAALLEDVKNKALSQTRPTRPTYNP